MKTLLVQLNTTPNDFEGNKEKIIKACEKAKNENVELIVFPECSIGGYLSKDLIYYNDFIEQNNKVFYEILNKSYHEYKDLYIVFGYVSKNTSLYGKPFRNSCACFYNGQILGTYHKQLIPFYDVFDEGRYFEPDDNLCVVKIKGEKWGFVICEDLWNDKGIDNYNYKNNPLEKYKKYNIKNIISINASPFSKNKNIERLKLLENVSKNLDKFIYVNQVGGQDELVFDGKSCAFHKNELKVLGDYKEYIIFDFDDNETHKYKDYLSDFKLNSLYPTKKAIIQNIKDYFEKSGFKEAVVGSSGGIDSAVVISLLCEALGSKNVHAIRMPSIYNDESSIEDAKELHKNLNCNDYLVPLNHLDFTNYINEKIKSENIKEYNPKIANENIQARLRGNILMYFSNKTGALLVTTGNKSELAVGYCTLYGDMCGGKSVINDLYKTEVYKMAKLINITNEIIPISIIEKEPSAQLSPNQKDTDSLPEYHILDEILKCYIEQRINNYKDFINLKMNEKLKHIVLISNEEKNNLKNNLKEEFEEEIYYKVIRMVEKNEFKRIQMPVGIKLSQSSFGIGWRFPIVKHIK